MKKIKGSWLIVIMIIIIVAWVVIRYITNKAEHSSSNNIVDVTQAKIDSIRKADSLVKDKSQKENTKQNQPTTTETPKPTQGYKIGDLIKFDDSEWIIASAWNNGKKMESNLIFQEDATTEGMFITVCFKVKNLNNTEVTIIDTPKLIDSQGREFSEYTNEAWYVPKNTHTIEFESLPPGLTKQYYAIFEVPADANNFKFQAQALARNGDQIPVSIGF